MLTPPWVGVAGKQGNFLKDMAGWVADGKVKVAETFFEGADKYGEAFQALFTGGNTGKVVVKVEAEARPRL